MNPQERFCPNMACPARGRVGEGNIVIHSQKEKRYKWMVCRKTFGERSSTAYYRLHHNEALMTVVIALLANGCPPQAIVAVYGLDERTVAKWQERAGKYGQAVHEHLVQRPREPEHVQADEVRVKAQGQVFWMATLAPACSAGVLIKDTTAQTAWTAFQRQETASNSLVLMTTVYCGTTDIPCSSINCSIVSPHT